ncbi:MAG: hypothetical protein ABEJ27_02820 [Halodesulfurarchaeum sp.]
MTLPAGQPCFDRVVMSVDEPLEAALDRSLSGYGIIVPQAGLLGDGAGEGVIWFAEGVPIRARHTASGRTGSEALADIAETGPYRVRLVEVGGLEEAAADPDLSPGAPAERLAGNEALAERTREAATHPVGGGPAEELDAVEAFLADTEKIEAIQRQARAEARQRATEWGLDDLAAEDPDRQ